MKMSCEECQQLIPWLLDDEIEPEQVLEVEAHLDTCDACREVLEAEGRLRLALRRASEHVLAPPSLRGRIRSLVGAERHRSGAWVQFWPAAAAAAILLALIWKSGTASWAPELEEAAQGHARDLPLDVVAANADMAPLQRYFNSKLPFAVQMPKLGAEPVALGGRVTHLHNREAAYLRYEMPRGRVSFFVYEDPGSDISEIAPFYQIGTRQVMFRRIRGYTVARWRNSGLVYSVVTELPESDVASVLKVNFAP